MATVPPFLLTLNLLLRVYHQCRFPRPKNHVLDDVEIHDLLGAVI